MSRMKCRSIDELFETVERLETIAMPLSNTSWVLGHCNAIWTWLGNYRWLLIIAIGLLGYKGVEEAIKAVPSLISTRINTLVDREIEARLKYILDTHFSELIASHSEELGKLLANKASTEAFLQELKKLHADSKVNVAAIKESLNSSQDDKMALEKLRTDYTKNIPAVLLRYNPQQDEENNRYGTKINVLNVQTVSTGVYNVHYAGSFDCPDQCVVLALSNDGFCTIGRPESRMVQVVVGDGPTRANPSALSVVVFGKFTSDP